MNNNSFKNEVAVVTGAGGRLCSVIAKDLAEKGCKVVLLDRSKEALIPVVEAIQLNGGECMCEIADVTNETSMQIISDKILNTWGPCKYLINGAGGNNNKAITSIVSFKPEELDENKSSEIVGLFDLDIDVIESVIKINTIGTFIPSRIFAKQMAAYGGGSILNFASMNSYRPLTKVPAYAMSKAAVVNMTQWLATYLAPANIRVNAIAPGFFINERSKLILGTPEDGLTPRGINVMNHTPLGRFGNPEDLLGCVNWLLDNNTSSYVTGITVPVDGGFLAHSGI